MVNKKWLIKIDGNDNLWYDSEERVYRFRMHCPYCGKVSGCQCYHELEHAELDSANEINYCCTSKCALLNGEWDNIGEALSIVGVKRKISELTEEESAKLITSLLVDEDTQKDVLWVIDTLVLRKTSKELNHDDRIEVLKSFDESDVDDWCDTIGIKLGKDIEDLSEEEAGKVLEVLMEDGDFDSPMGETCK